jgi:hypothetical protein
MFLFNLGTRRAVSKVQLCAANRFTATLRRIARLMNPMKFRFVVRHSFAAATVLAISAPITAAIYFGLLAWAVVKNGGLGGPLALPGMILLVFAATAASVIFILAPTTALAEILRVKLLRTNRFAEVPIASLILIVYIAVAFSAMGLSRGWPPRGTILSAAIVTVIQLLLLGIYWWTVQATDLLISAVRATGIKAVRIFGSLETPWPAVGDQPPPT